MDQGPSRRQPERRRLSALSPADHRRRQVDGNIERRDSRALPSGLLRCVARRAGSGGAAGAGARGLNLSEAKSCDVGAAPTLPVWPGSPPAAGGSCVSTPSTMIAAGKTIDLEAGPEPWNKDQYKSWRRPDKVGDSADCCHSTTGWCAQSGGWSSTSRRAPQMIGNPLLNIDGRLGFSRSAHDGLGQAPGSAHPRRSRTRPGTSNCRPDAKISPFSRSGRQECARIRTAEGIGSRLSVRGSA